MNFEFDVVEFFGDGVSLLDNRMTPVLVEHGSPDGSMTAKITSSPRRSRHDSVRRDRLYSVIDRMGEASAKAQGLHGSITGGSRLSHSDHHLYVMVDRKTDRTCGSVVGILKVGHKTLFVYDHQNRQREMYPLCVLDFYVHESRQRTGCGRKLFDCMLRRESVRVEHMAIDRPSHKFSSFLRKHYNLKAVIPQVNNFVVFEGFFSNRTDDQPVRRIGSGASRPPSYPYKTRPYSHYDRVTSCGYAEHTKLVNEVDPYRGVSLPRSRSRERLNQAFGQSEKSTGLQQDQNRSAGEPLQPDVRGIPTPETRAPEVVRATPEVVRTTPEVVRTTPASPSRACAAEANMYSRHIPRITTPQLDSSPVISRPRDGPSNDYKRFITQLNSHQDYQDRRGHLVVSNTPTSQSPAQPPSQPITIPGSSQTAHQSTFQSRSLPNQNFDRWRDQSQQGSRFDQSQHGSRFDQSQHGSRLDQSPYRSRFDQSQHGSRFDQSPYGARFDPPERCKTAGGTQPTSWTVFGTPPSYQGRKWQHTKLW